MSYTKTVILFFFFSVSIFSQTSLGYTLKVGDVFLVEQTAHQNIVQEMDGATHEITNDMGGLLEFKVLSEKDSIYEIALAFKELNLLMNSSIQGELMKVKASEVVEDDVQSKIFNSLLNTPVKLKVAKTGDILEVIGGDSLVTKMTNASGVEDEFSKNLMKKSLEKEFGSEALSNSYKQLTYIYSDSIVSIGDSWQNEYTGKLNAKNTWTLNEINEQEASITGEAQVLINTSNSGTVMKLEGNQSTVVQADIASGFISKMTVTGASSGVSTMKQLGDQEIPTTITSTITYTLIKE